MPRRRIRPDLTAFEAEAILAAFGEVFAGAATEAHGHHTVAAMRRVEDKLLAALDGDGPQNAADTTAGRAGCPLMKYGCPRLR